MREPAKPVPLAGNQYGPPDDRRAGRPGRRGARPHPHPNGGGRNRAKGRGQHMGRPPALTAPQQQEARRRRADGATLKELAKSYNVGLATISRVMKGVA